MSFDHHIITSVAKAYENEIEIDKSIGKAFDIQGSLPNYRILKLLCIKKKLGFLFFMFN